MPSFGDGPQYWDARYLKSPDPYDWLLSYGDLKNILAHFSKGSKAVKILNVGCGNSLLPEEMYDDGYHDIVNIDNAAVAIKQMSDRNKELRPELEWLVADAMAMDLEDDTFDFVIDKSTLDAFTCGNNSTERVDTFLKEVSRVMKDTGVYFCITFGTPDTRVIYFKKPHLGFDVQIMRVPLPYDEEEKTCQFVYACRKAKQKKAGIWQGNLGDVRYRGTVDHYCRKRGFGLIEPCDIKLNGSENGKDSIFVHWKEILSADNWPSLEAGAEVEYEVGVDETGRTVAKRVSFVEGVQVATANEMRELSTFTVTGIVKHWSSKGFGFIKIDSPIKWPTPLEAGSDVYVSREDIMTDASLTMSLVPGQTVCFKVYRSAGKKDSVAAAEVTAGGGAYSRSWTDNGFASTERTKLQKQLGSKRQKLQW